MSVPVLFVRHVDRADPEVIVKVFRMFRCETFQHPLKVLQQQWFIFVNKNGSGCVFTLNIQNSFPDCGQLQKSSDRLRAIQKLQATTRLKLQNLVMNSE